MLDITDAIKAYKDFEARSTAAMSTQMDRIRDDRDYLGGKQWDSDDDDLIDPSRNRRTVNVLPNTVNAVSNQYSAWPYKWYTGDQEIDQVLDAFLDTKSNKMAPQQALRSSVGFGLGVMCLGSEQLDGVTVPCLYSPADITSVRLDPDSVELDGSDAMEGAVIEMRSKSWIRAKYGEDYVAYRGSKPAVDISSPHSDDQQPVVTYYKVEDGQCTVYKMLNDQFLADPVTLPIDRVPMFPVYGEPYWDDDKVLYQGIVRKAKEVQRLLNYSYTQLGERLAQAPKNTWLATVDAVEGLTSGYKQYSRNTNPLLMYNRTTIDGKTVLEPPKRMDNSVQYGDVQAIIAGTLDLMSSITGVDSKGIIDSNNSTTATEVLYAERSAQTNIRHYYDNLRITMKAVGDTVLAMLGVRGISVDICQGPEEDMGRQVARTELMQLAGMVPDQNKLAIVDGVLMSHGDNAILRQVYGILHGQPTPTAMEEQAMATIEQMKAAIQERDQKLQEMQQTIQMYESNDRSEQRGLQAQFAMKNLEHQQEMETMAFKAQLDQGANADQAKADAISKQMDLEKQAIQLDTARVKADAEKAKIIGGMNEIIPIL